MKAHPLAGIALVAAVVLAGYAPRARADKQAPANAWVKIAEEPTGGREWPMFHFHPGLKQFVLSGGGHEGKPHFDTELFDATSATWRNAYPENSPYAAESGPTDAPKVDHGDKAALKADQNGVVRILRHLNPYLREPATYFQSTLNRDDGRIYAYFQDATLAYDPKTRTWADLGAAPFSQRGEHTLTYGSLAYDPVNREVVSVGGTSNERGGSPGTWVFRPAENKWERRAPGALPELLDARVRAASLRDRLSALANAARNRFYAAESADEARAGSPASAATLLASEFAALAGTVSMPTRPAAEAKALSDDLMALARRGAQAAPLDLLVETARLSDLADRLVRTLDAEPSPRGVTQMAVDPVAGKILLFGGCTLDGYLGDTWVYDCKTRTWEQRFPKRSPAPRAGHALAFLPKSGKFVLYGNVPFTNPYGVPHGNKRPPRDLWAYDLAKDEWTPLAAETKDSPADGVGAVDSDDNLIVVARDAKNRAKRVTWAMRVDPGAPDESAANVEPATDTFTRVFNSPTDYDRAAKVDHATTEKLLGDLPANQWTPLAAPATKSPNGHPWGTTAYDTRRHQFLAFGGGHCEWHFNDVAHFAVRTAAWSTGYAEEYPYANASFKAFFDQTFRDRPSVPTHVWDAAAYDPVADRLVICVRGTTWTYDPAARAWDYPPGPKFPGMLDVSMSATPRGVVHWDRQGRLHLFDGKARAWNPLPLPKPAKGESPIGGAYGDNTGICYDAKRDAVWLARDGGPMHRYDFATQALTTFSVRRPKGIVMRETTYVPELDMILSAGRTTGANGEVGNLAYDIAGEKWVGVVMPFADGQPRQNDKPYSTISLALHYDATLQRLILLANNQKDVFVARVDKATVKTFDVPLQEPKPK